MTYIRQWRMYSTKNKPPPAFRPMFSVFIVEDDPCLLVQVLAGDVE